MLSNHPRMVAGVLLCMAGVGSAPARADVNAVALSSGSFFSANYSGNRMSCQGSTTKTCSHVWDATTCLESAGGTNVYTFCDAYGGGTTRGTGASGNLCTTTNVNPRLNGSIIVESFYGSFEVPVDIVQTNGNGVFRGSLTTTARTITVNGTFNTPGVDGGPCTVATRGDFAGTFTISAPV